MRFVETYNKLHHLNYKTQWQLKSLESLLLKYIIQEGIFSDIHNEVKDLPMQISNIMPMGEYLHITMDFIGKNKVYTKIIKFYEDKIDVVEGYIKENVNIF